ASLGGVPAVPARVRVEFSRGFGVYISLGSCTDHRLAAPATTASDLADLWDEGRWQPDLCMVSSALETAGGVIAISSGRAASIDVEIAVSDNSTQWTAARVLADGGVDYKCELASSATPLLRLARLFPPNELRLRDASASAPYFE